MFYPVLEERAAAVAVAQKLVSAIVVLTPAESKRIIAKGVAVLPEVKHALTEGVVVISRGTTNAFVAEELVGVPVSKVDYAAGVIARGELTTTPPETRLKPYILRPGKPVQEFYPDVIKAFTL